MAKSVLQIDDKNLDFDTEDFTCDYEESELLEFYISERCSVFYEILSELPYIWFIDDEDEENYFFCTLETLKEAVATNNLTTLISADDQDFILQEINNKRMELKNEGIPN